MRVRALLVSVLASLVVAAASLSTLTVTAAPAAASQTSVVVSAKTIWTDTGVDVTPGEPIFVSASGSWSAAPFCSSCPLPGGPTGPDGYSTPWGDNFLNLADIGNGAAGGVTPTPHLGALIGFVGPVPPAPGSYGTDPGIRPIAADVFVVGDRAMFARPESGRLWLGFNDDAYSGNVGDNDGSLNAVISTTPQTDTPPPPASSVVQTWVPNGAVSAIVPTPTTIYLGGGFSALTDDVLSTANTVPRHGAAAIDAHTGLPVAWNPDVDGAVSAMALVGDRVFLAGSFTHVGGQARNHLAAVDATTGAVDGWDPNADSAVNELVVAGGTVFVGGGFTSVGGEPRTWLAAIDAATGVVRPWHADLTPATDVSGLPGGIWALAAGGDTVYFSGGFIAVGGQPRSFLAAVDAVTGSPRSWNFNPDPSQIFTPGAGVPYSHVTAIAVDAGRVYLGGNREFLQAAPGGGFTVGPLLNAAFLRAVDPVTAAPDSSWNPNPNTNIGSTAFAQITSIVIAGPTVYVGGMFQTIGGSDRFVLAGVDATTGLATDFAPSVTNWSRYQRSTVTTLAVMGSAVFAAGGFTVGFRSDGTSLTLNPLGFDPGMGVPTDSLGFAIFGLDISTTCAVTALRDGPPKQQDVTVQDVNGLQSIININITNGTVNVPTFTPGTTSPVVVTATKTDPDLGTFWEFDAVDSLGNVHHCV
jgi:hypothetical protein